MRSIAYIVTGRPKNRADCLDYAFKRNLMYISYELHVRGVANEDYAYKELYATFVWRFDSTTIAYDEVYGAWYYHEDDERKGISIENANRRLKHAVDVINSRIGTDLQYDKQFEHSLIIDGDNDEAN